MSVEPWIPPDVCLEDEDLPIRLWGYDGKLHPKRVRPHEWRSYRVKRARKLGTHTNQEWKALCERIGRCMRCGATGGLLTKDHIIPVSNRMGSDAIENIQPLCLPCNANKGNGL